MKTLYAIFLTLIIHHVDLSSCTEGCLACARNSLDQPVCWVCDGFRHFRLSSNGSCFKLHVEHCQVPSSDPEHRACFLCEPGHFLDNLGRRCSPVPENRAVPHCSRYHWEYSCTQCEDGFYLARKVCLPVTKLIDHCRHYLDAKNCAQCENGFFFHLGTKRCEILTERDHCSVYSSVECSRCEKGYFKVKNGAPDLEPNSSFLQSFFTYQVLAADSSYYESKPIKQCIQGTLPNCLVHESFDQCSECEPDYFLSPAKTCESFPIYTVAHCEAYRSANTCSRCKAGFYLENNFCTESTHTKGCLEFDLSTEDCSKCDFEHFYLDQGVCGLRTKSLDIEFCKQKSETGDHCVECVASFKLTDDSLKCLPHIPHCSEYVSNTDTTDQDFTNQNSTQLDCATCADHFYLSSNKRECIPQVSVGCLEFIPNTNDCNLCASGYFKENGACFTYTREFCKTMEMTSDACAECFDGFYLSGSDCLQYTARNCLTFDPNANNCASCAAMYYPASSGSPPQTHCEFLTARNCKSFVKNGSALTNQCADCFPGYELVAPDCLPVALLNCAVQESNTKQCTTCKSGYFKSTNICKPYTVRNCDVYKEDADECESCLYTVTPQHPANVFYLDVNKNCIPYTARNCLTKDDSSNTCLTCPTNRDYYINAQGDCEVSSVNHCLRLDPGSSTNACAHCLHGFKMLNGRCFKEHLLGCVQYEDNTSNNYISPDHGKCRTCATGFYLEEGVCRPQTRINCATFNTDSDGCASCLSGYVRNLSTGECNTPITHNCVEYSVNPDGTLVCSVCGRGFYLNSLSCLPQSIPNCLIHQPNLNRCEQCRVQFTLDATREHCSPHSTLHRCMQVDPHNPNKCATCFRGSKLNAVTSLCETADTIPHCLEYESNTGRCLACVYGRVLNEFKSACDYISYSIMNCQKYSLNDGSCEVCGFGYYLVANECKAQEVENCLVYKPNVNECLQCKSNHFLDEQNCTPNSPIANCVHYNVGKNKCIYCETNYYLLDNKCFLNSLASCKFKRINQNKCVNCLTNYVLGDNQDCGGASSGPDPLCFKYNPSSGECTLCKSGYSLNNSTKACDPITPDPSGYEIDPKCLGTKDSSSKCEFCPQGNVSLELNTVKVDWPGCGKVDPSTGDCVQCAEDHDRPQPDNRSCLSTSSSSSPCKQLLPNVVQGSLITDPGKCSKCSDRNYTDFSGNTCTFRKTTNAEGNTADGPWSQKYFAWGSVKATLTNPTYECGTINSLSPEDDNCTTYNYDSGKCERCVYGFHSKNLGDECTQGTGTISVPYYIKFIDGQFLPGDYSDHGSNTPSEVEIMIEITDSTTGGVEFTPYKCAAGKARMFDPSTVSSINFKFAAPTETTGYDTSNISFAASYNSFDCFSESFDRSLTSNNTTEATLIDVDYPNRCAYWTRTTVSNNEYVKCMGCEPGHYPVIRKTAFYKDPPVLGSTTDVYTAHTPSDEFFKSFVDDCKTWSDISGMSLTYTDYDKTREFQGLNYNLAHDVVRLSVFVNVDSCDTGSLVVFGKAHRSTLVPHNYTASIGTLTGVVLPLVCFDSNLKGVNYFLDDSASIDTPGGVANCQIHYWKQQGTDMDVDGTITSQIGNVPLDKSRLGCLSCKPGHAYVNMTKYTNTLEIDTCPAIAHCDLTGVNKWMNACQNCDAGFGWEMSSTFTLRFEKCVQSTTPVANCLIYKDDGTGTGTNSYSCWLCKKPFFLRDDNSGNKSCVSVTKFTGCTTLDRPGFILRESTDYANENVMVYHYLVGAYFQEPLPYCKECIHGNYFIRNESPGNQEYYTKDFTTQLTWNSESADEKCMYFDNNYASSNCQLCRDDKETNRFVFDHHGNCHKKEGSGALWFGCVEMDEDHNCTRCRHGHSHFFVKGNTLDKHCYAPDDVVTLLNCSNFDPSTGTCEICRANSVHDPQKPYRCVEYRDGDCSRLNIDGSCFECAGQNQYPVNYKVQGATSNPLYTFVCADQENSLLDSFRFGFQFFDFDDSSFKTHTHLPSDELIWVTTSSAQMLEASGKRVKHKCLNVFGGVFANCLQASTNGIECSKCAEGYTLVVNAADFNACTKDPASAVYSPCFKFYPDSVECEVCAGELKKDLSTGLCLPRALTRNEYKPDPVCAGNNSTDLECEFCPEGNKSVEIKYYKYGTSKSGTDCLKLNSAETGCELCKPGFEYADETGTGCVQGDPSTDFCSVLTYPYAPGAKAEFGTQDCLICLPHHELDSGQCSEPASAGFNTYLEIDSGGNYSVEPQPWATKKTSALTRNVVECALPYGAHTVTPIAKCSIYSRDGDCHLCEPGFSGTDCLTTAAGPEMFPAYNEHLELVNLDASFVKADVLVAMQLYNGVDVPVQCTKAKYMMQIDMGGDFKRRTAYRVRTYSSTDTEDIAGLEFTRSYPAVKCEAYVPGSTAFVAASDTEFGIASKVKSDPAAVPTSFSDTDCAYWVETDHFGFKCARCMDGFVPVIRQATGTVLYNTTSSKDVFDDTAVFPMFTQGAFMEACIAPDPSTTGTAERKYQGLSNTSFVEYPKGAYISIDNCTSPDEIPVVFGKWESSGVYNYQFFDSATISKLEGPNAGEVYTQVCVNYTNTDLFAAGQTGAKDTIGVANCQIFGLEVAYHSTPVTLPKITDQSELKCLSCRPGYRATNDANKTFITACTLIANCDVTPANNTWMNACQTCSANFAWKYDTTAKVLSQAECIDSSSSPNCDVLDSAIGTNCVMCSPGYVLMNDGTCVVEGIKAAKNCADLTDVHPYTALEFPSTPSTQEELRSLAF